MKPKPIDIRARLNALADATPPEQLRGLGDLLAAAHAARDLESCLVVACLAREAADEMVEAATNALAERDGRRPHPAALERKLRLVRGPVQGVTDDRTPVR